jgi:aminoglycoside phosphotransferase (APT) family kinase protein
MTEPWKAEREWSRSEVSEVVRAQCPMIACQTVEPFGCGWDNAAFLIDGEWVFRFARRAIAAPLLEREANVLPRLASSLPVPIPRPEWFGRVGDWPFAGYRRLTGRPASDLSLDNAARHRLARPLGEFLRALHDLPSRNLDVIPEPLGRLDIEKWQPRAIAMLDDCDGGLDIATLRRLIDTVDPNPQPAILSHGDLYSRHLLVEEGRLTGVIDWGDVCLAEPAIDLAVAFTFLSPSAREIFFTAYSNIDETTASRARFRAICHALNVYRYAKSITDAPLDAE